jgi:opacity protein-like surface antigen
MKMKSLLLGSLLLATNFIMAQGAFSLRIAGGYAGPGLLKSDPVYGPIVDPYRPERDGLVEMANRNFFSDSSVQFIRGSYGQGMNFTLGLGYMINPYIGFDMGINYQQSSKMKSVETHDIILNNPPFVNIKLGQPITATISTSAYTLSLMPSIVVAAALPNWKAYPYARLGLTLPVFGALFHDLDIVVPDSLFDKNPGFDELLGKEPYYIGRKTDVRLETHGTISLGFNGAVGVAYKPLPFLNVFAEVNAQYLTVRAKDTKITKYDIDGVDKLEERGKYRTEFVYSDKLNTESNNADFNPNYDRTKPKDDLRKNAPFHYFGFNVGVTFLLSKTTLKKKEVAQ